MTVVACVLPVVVVPVACLTLGPVIAVKTKITRMIEGSRTPAVGGMTLIAVLVSGLVQVVKGTSMTGYAVIYTLNVHRSMGGRSITLCLNEFFSR